MTRVLALIVAVSISLCGCVTTRVTDLKPVRVEAVWFSSQQELVSRSKVPLSQQERLLLKVSFRTATNLVETVRELGPLQNEPTLCEHPDEESTLWVPGVFLSGVEFSRAPTTDAEPTGVFYSYVNVSHRPDNQLRNGVPISYRSYDLEAHPESICLKLVGGSYRRIGYDSNQITFGAAEVSTALREAKKP